MLLGGGVGDQNVTRGHKGKGLEALQSERRGIVKKSLKNALRELLIY